MSTESTTERQLPSPPFISVSGIHNFRDLGGYAISSLPGKIVKSGTIYRAAEPQKVTKDGITTMNGLGITHIYDLRSENEIERMIEAGRGGVVEWEGCERVFVPVFATKDYGPESLAVRYRYYASDGTEGFAQAYTDILNAAAPHSYRTILLHLANEPGKPLIVHCTAGKDRTGVICALILSLCGVEDEIIAEEYALTEQGLPNVWKQEVISHMMQNPALKDNMKGALNMISARKENMLASLRVIHERFGGAESYAIDKCGLTKEDVERIRLNLIVERTKEGFNSTL